MSFSSIRPSSVPNCVCGLQLSLISSTEEAIKNGLTLPTGQWYAPSAVDNDAWYCMVLHGITLYCMVLHGITWCCMVLHGIALYGIVLHGIA